MPHCRNVRTHARTHTRTHARTHTRTHSHTHTHTHSPPIRFVHFRNDDCLIVSVNAMKATTAKMRRSKELSNGDRTTHFHNRTNSRTEKTRHRDRDPLECLLRPSRRSRHRLSPESGTRRWYDSTSVDDASSTSGYAVNGPTAHRSDPTVRAPTLQSTIAKLDSMRLVGSITDSIHLSEGGLAFGKPAWDSGNNNERQWNPRIGERKRGDFRTLRKSGQHEYNDGVKPQSETDTTKRNGYSQSNSQDRHVDEPFKHYERDEKVDVSRSPYRGFPKKSAVECPSWSSPSYDAISKHERLRYFDQIISDFNSRSSSCSQYDSSSQRGFLVPDMTPKGDGRPQSLNSHLDSLRGELGAIPSRRVPPSSPRVGHRPSSPEQDLSAVSRRSNLDIESPRRHTQCAPSRIANHAGSARRNIAGASPLVSSNEMSPRRRIRPTSPRHKLGATTARRDTRHIVPNVDRSPSPPRRNLDGNVMMDVRLPQPNSANKSMDKERYNSLLTNLLTLLY